MTKEYIKYNILLKNGQVLSIYIHVFLHLFVGMYVCTYVFVVMSGMCVCVCKYYMFLLLCMFIYMIECLHDYQYFIFHLKYDIYLLEKKKSKQKSPSLGSPWFSSSQKCNITDLSRVYRCHSYHIADVFSKPVFYVRRAKPYLDFSWEWLRKKLKEEFL